MLLHKKPSARFHKPSRDESQMKLTQKRLRAIINETINEESMQQAKLRGPIQKFVEHLNMAKQDLNLVVQGTSDRKSMDSATMLLNTITKMIKAVGNMPELSGGSQPAPHG